MKEFLARFETLLPYGTSRGICTTLSVVMTTVQLLRVTASARGVPPGTLSQFSTCGTDSSPSVDPRRRPVRLGRVPELACRSAIADVVASGRDRSPRASIRGVKKRSLSRRGRSESAGLGPAPVRTAMKEGPPLVTRSGCHRGASSRPVFNVARRIGSQSTQGRRLSS